MKYTKIVHVLSKTEVLMSSDSGVLRLSINVPDLYDQHLKLQHKHKDKIEQLESNLQNSANVIEHKDGQIKANLKNIGLKQQMINARDAAINELQSEIFLPNNDLCKKLLQTVYELNEAVERVEVLDNDNAKLSKDNAKLLNVIITKDEIITAYKDGVHVHDGLVRERDEVISMQKNYLEKNKKKINKLHERLAKKFEIINFIEEQLTEFARRDVSQRTELQALTQDKRFLKMQPGSNKNLDHLNKHIAKLSEENYLLQRQLENECQRSTCFEKKLHVDAARINELNEIKTRLQDNVGMLNQEVSRVTKNKNDFKQRFYQEVYSRGMTKDCRCTTKPLKPVSDLGLSTARFNDQHFEVNKPSDIAISIKINGKDQVK